MRNLSLSWLAPRYPPMKSQCLRSSSLPPSCSDRSRSFLCRSTAALSSAWPLGSWVPSIPITPVHGLRSRSPPPAICVLGYIVRELRRRQTYLDLGDFFRTGRVDRVFVPNSTFSGALILNFFPDNLSLLIDEYFGFPKAPVICSPI